MSVVATKFPKKYISWPFHSLLRIHTKPAEWISDHSTDIQTDVRRLCKRGQVMEALHILQITGAAPNNSTYVSLLHACISKKNPCQGKLVHAHIIQTLTDPDLYLDNALVIMYTKCGKIVDACKLFDEMPERNVVSWTALISCYAGAGFGKQALEFLRQMKQTGVWPNEFTYPTILSVCGNLVGLGHGKEIHGDIIKAGFEFDLFVGSTIIYMYVKCGNVEDARQVFDKMPERSVVSWTAMVDGYAQSGHFDKALELFEIMPERNVVSWTAMIAGCVQNGHFHEALNLFRKMPERDIMSWNAMISGYAQHSYLTEALEFFKQMQLSGMKPNSVTLTSLLPVCANLAALEQGKELHEDIIRKRFQSDVILGNALVDMYAKCGSIEDSRKVFDRMPKRDVFSWSSMIGGYAMHGFAYDALQLFEQMQTLGIKPDHVTFLGVLSGCCHAGLVNDGWHYFNSMSRDYCIRPSLEHYSCMVDLLGRAGRLNEALDIVNMMPIKPDVIVWASLLSACKTHSNVELGEYVAERLFELDPENADHYVLMSNIYATVGKWDEVKKIRRMMKERRVEKTPGLSWIGVNNKVNTFVIGDRLHPHTIESYR